MALRKSSIETKNKILSVCVRNFIEQGYHQTPISQIIKEADVSISTFQNIFHTKDGILYELVEFMFGGQFKAARSIASKNLPPVYIYAAETAIQLVLTELNENLRDIYIEAYSVESTAEYIYQHTARELYQIFGEYFPAYSESDFYELDIGSCGIMRGYMERRCDIHFTLEKKIECFLTLSLRVYKVPEDEIKNIIAFIKQIDINSIANQTIQQLFHALEMRFDFKLD